MLFEAEKPQVNRTVVRKIERKKPEKPKNLSNLVPLVYKKKVGNQTLTFVTAEMKTEAIVETPSGDTLEVTKTEIDTVIDDKIEVSETHVHIENVDTEQELTIDRVVVSDNETDEVIAAAASIEYSEPAEEKIAEEETPELVSREGLQLLTDPEEYSKWVQMISMAGGSKKAKYSDPFSSSSDDKKQKKQKKKQKKQKDKKKKKGSDDDENSLIHAEGKKKEYKKTTISSEQELDDFIENNREKSGCSCHAGCACHSEGKKERNVEGTVIESPEQLDAYIEHLSIMDKTDSGHKKEKRPMETTVESPEELDAYVESLVAMRNSASGHKTHEEIDVPSHDEQGPELRLAQEKYEKKRQFSVLLRNKKKEIKVLMSQLADEEITKKRIYREMLEFNHSTQKKLNSTNSIEKMNRLYHTYKQEMMQFKARLDSSE